MAFLFCTKNLQLHGIFRYNSECMAKSTNNNSAKVEVTFTLEEHPLTFAQKEAGKRFYSRLIARAQAQLQAEKENKEDIAKTEKAGWSAQVDRRKPPPASEDEKESPLH